MRIATDFCERVGVSLPCMVAVGGPADDVSGVTRARTTADRVLRVLSDGHVTQRVARLVDVQTQALLLELRDLAASRGEGPVGPIAFLLDHDERAAGGLIETLEAWLDAFGDVAAAAAALYIHPNTLRYRLRKITELSGLDLTDPEQRFAAMLQLRILTRP